MTGHDDSSRDQESESSAQGADDPHNDIAAAERRRRLIKWVVGVAIAIPVVIEARTISGLIGNWLTGSDENAGDRTATEQRVGLGDELLPATAPPEILERAVVEEGDDVWPFRVAVSVENTADQPYEFRLGDVITDADERVRGGATSGVLSRGESTRIETNWGLPTGSTPKTLTVRGLTGPPESPTETIKRVHLANVPVEG